jgi:hypothetical protein
MLDLVAEGATRFLRVAYCHLAPPSVDVAVSWVKPPLLCVNLTSIGYTVYILHTCDTRNLADPGPGTEHMGVVDSATWSRSSTTWRRNVSHPDASR